MLSNYQQSRSAGAALVIVLLSTACAPASRPGKAVGAGEGEGGGEGATGTVSYLALATSQGEIVIEMHADAAPEAVDRILGLARSESREAGSGNFFEGLAFDYARPHIELRTELRESESEIRFENEIDARALGLDERRIEDAAMAMDVLQRELLASRSKGKRGEQLQPRLREWIDTWHESYSSDFLVGISRMEVLEALGHRFTTGLSSRPVRRGAVTLVPIAVGVCEPRLNLHLSDQREKDGIWMVVGTIVRGLELADSISMRPLGRDKDTQYQPVEPVRIEGARIVDGSYLAGTGSESN